MIDSDVRMTKEMWQEFWHCFDYFLKKGGGYKWFYYNYIPYYDNIMYFYRMSSALSSDFAELSPPCKYTPYGGITASFSLQRKITTARRWYNTLDIKTYTNKAELIRLKDYKYKIISESEQPQLM